MNVLFHFCSYLFNPYKAYITCDIIIQNQYFLTRKRFLTVFDSLNKKKHGINQFLTPSCQKQVFEIKNPTLVSNIYRCFRCFLVPKQEFVLNNKEFSSRTHCHVTTCAIFLLLLKYYTTIKKSFSDVTQNHISMSKFNNLISKDFKQQFC